MKNPNQHSNFVKVDKRRSYGTYEIILTNGDKKYVYKNLTGRQAKTLERTLVAKYSNPNYTLVNKLDEAKNNKSL